MLSICRTAPFTERVVAIKTGTKKKKDLRYISINKICEKLGDSLTKLLPVLHSITGCDWVSSFADIGKKTAFNHLKSNAEEFERLQSSSELSMLYLEVCMYPNFITSVPSWKWLGRGQQWVSNT